jgi:Tfp pilus assembly protein PilF
VRHRAQKPSGFDTQTPDQREAEDVRVAQYYLSTSNFNAAYLRAKDAVRIDATDPDAFVALGDAARRLGKLDEAQKSYEKALKLDPFPKTRKAAEKALAEMRGGK